MDPAEESPLIALFRHNTWANLRLLDACAALNDNQLAATAPGTFGALGDTLRHLVGNEENYLDILTGRPPEHPLPRTGWPGIPALRVHARQAGEGLAAAAGTVRLADVLHPVYEGQATALPAYIVLIQAINHATEHRTHVTTILTQQGITPPALDGWTYLDDGQ